MDTPDNTLRQFKPCKSRSREVEPSSYQPAGLPSNVICLPRVVVQVDDPAAFPANVPCRKNARFRIKQIPLRQAFVGSLVEAMRTSTVAPLR